MNYCTNCGNKVDSNAFFCIHCGVKLKNEVAGQVNNSVDNGGFGWGLLGFFIPVVGLVLYLVWKDEKPKTANAAGKGALTYLIFCVVLVMIMFVFGIVLRKQVIDNNYYDDYYYDFD